MPWSRLGARTPASLLTSRLTTFAAPGLGGRRGQRIDLRLSGCSVDSIAIRRNPEAFPLRGHPDALPAAIGTMLRLIDEFLPTYSAVERHQTIVRAPAEIVYQAIHSANLRVPSPFALC
jgi:hypothetical protein